MIKNTPFTINEFELNGSIDPHEIELEIARDKEYKKYGIPIGVFSSGKKSIFTKDEEAAMYYLDMGMELPTDLKQRLLNTLPERLERNRKMEANRDNKALTLEGIKKIFGIDIRRNNK